MKLMWLTDIHLEALAPRLRPLFMATLAAQAPQAVLLGGDFSNAPRLVEDLQRIENTLKVPVYFVLGNHEFWGGSIAGVREQARSLSRREKRLCFLEDAGWVRLTDETALVGHGCWGDGRAGNVQYSPLRVNLLDFREIADFKELSWPDKLSLLNRLGDEAADHLGRHCREAARQFRQILVLTHIVPFIESCMHEGRQDPEGLPFFCCAKAGEALKEVAGEFPEVTFTVLSGHTHTHAHRQILPNLKSRVQGAWYGDPRFELREI